MRGVYVGMTCGTTTNEAYIAVDDGDLAVDVFERCLASDWIDHPAIVRRAELSRNENGMSLSGSFETLAVPAPAPPAVAITEGRAATREEDLEFQGEGAQLRRGQDPRRVQALRRTTWRSRAVRLPNRLDLDAGYHCERIPSPR